MVDENINADASAVVQKVEVTQETYDRLQGDVEVVAPSINDLVDLPGMQPVYVDTDLYIKSSEQKPTGAIELASYGQGTVRYPPTPAKDLPALEASIKEDLAISLERYAVIKR